MWIAGPVRLMPSCFPTSHDLPAGTAAMGMMLAGAGLTCSGEIPSAEHYSCITRGKILFRLPVGFGWQRGRSSLTLSGGG